MRILRTSQSTRHPARYIKVPMAGKKTEDKAVGMSRGGRNTKIHTLVDGLGNPLAFMLSSGNDHDSVHAVSLLSQVNIERSNILGDKAYGAKAIREYIVSRVHCFSGGHLYNPAKERCQWSLAYRLAYLQRAASGWVLFPEAQVVSQDFHPLW